MISMLCFSTFIQHVIRIMAIIPTTYEREIEGREREKE
jgi:hypothetical protein